MKKFFVVSAVIAVATLVSCQKQQTEAEKNAEVERQVQERLAAEHQAEQQQQLQQQQADLDAREKALAEKENAAAATPARRERAEPEPVTRARAVSGAGPTSGYSTFYTKLEPHGAWLETADYGYVWQPREVESSQSWRPYTNGRWVYTDAGWTWISEEPFGWATYHYGRWTRLRGIGWVWVPGQQWAPAWVSWRKSNDYVGWAPLPPEARLDQRTGIHNWSDNYYDIGPDQYCFVATREFGAQRIESTIVPPERNVAIVNQTTNVTNITYNNTTIVNDGPNYDEVAKNARNKMKAKATPPSNAPSKRFVKAAATTTTASQGAEIPASWTPATATPLPSATISATPAPTAVATSTPETKITPPRVIPSEPSPTPATTSTPVSSASPLPTASQRRGRSLVPSARPPARTTPSATPKSAVSISPAASDTVSSGAIPAPSPAVTSTPMLDAASALSISPGGKLTKQEKKQQKREEKKELRRET